MRWKWEPQAPQTPHRNNLDLAVFPMMSKRHSHLLCNYTNRQTPIHDVLAYRIAKKVIANKGDNTFLQKQDFHSKVRNDFYVTKDGIAKKTRVLE